MKRNSTLLCLMITLAITTFCLVGALADGDPCPPGSQHKGPFSYRNRISATCTETGHHDKYCDACGRYIGTEIISAIGHVFETRTRIITLPTCVSNGLRQEYSMCIRCGYSCNFTDESLPAIGHNWGPWIVTKQPTCTDAGVETSTCRNDPTHIETRECPPRGHKEEKQPRIEPTCTEAGLSEGKHCSVCGEVILAQNSIPPTGHTVVIDQAVEATYTNTGLTSGKHCSVCGEVLLAQEIIPMLSRKIGDTTGDGIIDGRDVLRLAKYLAGGYYTEDIDTFDVNSDGKVDGRDLLRLVKYCAGMSVTLGK